MQDDILIFVHIPKAGGTTLNSIIYKNIDPNEIWKYCSYEHEHEVEGIKKAIKDDKLKSIIGHMACGFHAFTPNYKCITLLREPVPRVLSYFKHFQRTPITCRDKFVGIERTFDVIESSGWSITDLLESKVSNHVNNGYTRYFAGIGGLPLSITKKEELDKKDLMIAKQNIEKYFDVVGITEEYNKSLLLLRRYTQIKDIFYIKKNQAKKKPSNTIPDATLNLLAKYNEFDIELYMFAKDLMLNKFYESKLDLELLQFEDELKVFQNNYVTNQGKQIQEINNRLIAINKGNKVALYGCGEHTQKMFSMTEIASVDIALILDTYKNNAEYEGLSIMKADSVDVNSINIIIISNFAFQDTIISYLRDELGYLGEIISFYSGNDAVPFYEY